MKTLQKTFEDPVQGNGVTLQITNFKSKQSPRITVKCRDCTAQLKIFGEPGDQDAALEIGGVYASKKMWRNILLPLLDIEDEDAIVFTKDTSGNLKF